MNNMNNGTIVYLGGFELPDKNAAAHRVISNGKLLKSLGYDVVFCGVTKDGENGSLNSSHKVFGFKSYARAYPTSFRQWLSYFTDNNDYERLIEKYSNVKAVICYNMPSLPLYKLNLYCKKKNIKIFSDCTEWYKGSVKGNLAIGYIKRIDSVLRMRFVHKKLDGIIAISEFLHEFYSAKGVKTIKIPPLIDCQDMKWATSLKEIHKTIEIVYAGGAFSVKDVYVKDRIDLVVQSLSYLKTQGFKFYFKVVGCSLSDFEIFYPDLIKDLEILENDIKFFCKVPHEEAVELIKSSDYSIFLRDESIVTKAGFPTKFVESITSGIPVLTNNNSNVVDYLIDGENGFLIDTDSFETINKSMMIALSVEPNHLREMKVNTYKSHIFDYRKFIGEFRKLLD
ncbi:MAG: glycosyltransferase involved in cell wall biosynthesis [Sediminicola sp.]|jgi:glycosyltransferase involved in cell wall biosynthesis|tara:strand:- start:187 stop:1374 length:1188 start_codon:yes stop_codon:yes gene_type:complete